MRGGGGHARGELARIGVRGAAAIVVQIVEFADVGEAGFEHLRVSECAQCLEVIRIHALDELVHELAPAPETVGLGATPLGEAGQSALEGVAVKVRNPGQRQRVPLVLGSRRHPGGNFLDPTRGGADAYLRGPPLGQQRRFKPKTAHSVHY